MLEAIRSTCRPADSTRFEAEDAAAGAGCTPNGD
jgi:hypothetical protein